MIELKQYKTEDNFMVVGAVEDGKLLNFTVADLNKERATDKSFDTAYNALVWGKENYKSLL